MFENALELIKKYDVIVIHRHTNPDGDAMGSQIGLKHLITTNFPQKTVYVVGDDAKRYSFMEESEMQQIDDDVYKNALAIVLDSGNKELVSDLRFEKAKATLRFDHHIFCEKFCDVEIVDTSYESCCGLIADFARQNGWKLDKVGAQSLFTGMVTDSGRFRYDGTTSRTFELASFLMTQNFSTEELYNNLYVEDYDIVKLRAMFTLNMNRTPHGVGYVYSTLEDVEKYGVDTFTLSRGMVNTMAGIRGINIWANFTETENGVLCELRSNSANINQIAVKYGGGGHLKASGATLKNREEAFAMIDDLNKLLENTQ